LALIRHLNETNLLLQVSGGSEEAFGELFHAYHHQLGSYVMGWTKSISVTEEIIQDVFLKVWINRKALKEVERFDSYLYILCRNHAFNVLRQTARKRVRALEFEKHFQDEQEVGSDSFTEEYITLIQQAVASLPAQQQKVYILKREQGLKYDEIGVRLDISPETARKHLAAALKNITAHVRQNIPAILFLMAS
jgi:RNA polymerase sigma-70 factor (family 1)